MVWPSGLAWATNSAAGLPVAPVLVSTTACWPQGSERPAAGSRARGGGWVDAAARGHRTDEAHDPLGPRLRARVAGAEHRRPGEKRDEVAPLHARSLPGGRPGAIATAVARVARMERSGMRESRIT